MMCVLFRLKEHFDDDGDDKNVPSVRSLWGENWSDVKAFLIFKDDIYKRKFLSLASTSNVYFSKNINAAEQRAIFVDNFNHLLAILKKLKEEIFADVHESYMQELHGLHPTEMGRYYFPGFELYMRIVHSTPAEITSENLHFLINALTDPSIHVQSSASVVYTSSTSPIITLDNAPQTENLLYTPGESIFTETAALEVEIPNSGTGTLEILGTIPSWIEELNIPSIGKEVPSKPESKCKYLTKESSEFIKINNETWEIKFSYIDKPLVKGKSSNNICEINMKKLQQSKDENNSQQQRDQDVLLNKLSEILRLTIRGLKDKVKSERDVSFDESMPVLSCHRSPTRNHAQIEDDLRSLPELTPQKTINQTQGTSSQENSGASESRLPIVNGVENNQPNLWNAESDGQSELPNQKVSNDDLLNQRVVENEQPRAAQNMPRNLSDPTGQPPLLTDEAEKLSGSPFVVITPISEAIKKNPGIKVINFPMENGISNLEVAPSISDQVTRDLSPETIQSTEHKRKSRSDEFRIKNKAKKTKTSTLEEPSPGTSRVEGPSVNNSLKRKCSLLGSATTSKTNKLDNPRKDNFDNNLEFGLSSPFFSKEDYFKEKHRKRVQTGSEEKREVVEENLKEKETEDSDEAFYTPGSTQEPISIDEPMETVSNNEQIETGSINEPIDTGAVHKPTETDSTQNRTEDADTKTFRNGTPSTRIV